MSADMVRNAQKIAVECRAWRTSDLPFSIAFCEHVANTMDALISDLADASETAEWWEKECLLQRLEIEEMRRHPLFSAPDTSLPLLPKQDGPPDDPAALDAAAGEPMRDEAHGT